MIGRIRGTLVELTPDRAIVEAGGVGYDLGISLQTFYALSPSRGGPVTVAVHTHVREDLLALYGFHDGDERELFRALIGVGGIGPRVALAILSGIPAAELRGVVAEQDRVRLQKVPGVGKKTAERVLLELGDRMRRMAGAGAPTVAVPSGPADAGAGTIRTDAVSALANLGYPEDRARKAVDGALADVGDRDGAAEALEEVLRGALRRLAR